MPTVRFEPTTFRAASAQSGVAPQAIASRGTPVNYTPTGASAVAYGPVATHTTVVVKVYGGGVYLNHGAAPIAGALEVGGGHIPAGSYNTLALATGQSIAIITGELT